MDDKLKQIGRRIRETRAKAKLSQVDLGEKLGLSGAAISKYENGDADAGALSLQKIAELGDVTLDWLIAGVERDQLNGKVHGFESGAADAVLWRAVIESVEEHLQGNDQQLAPAKKAELITTLCEMFSEEEDKQVDKKTVAKLIRLAS